MLTLYWDELAIVEHIEPSHRIRPVGDTPGNPLMGPDARPAERTRVTRPPARDAFCQDMISRRLFPACSPPGRIIQEAA